MKRFEKDGLVVLGLNGEEDREREAKAARDLGIDYPVLLGMDTTARAYWSRGIPYTVLIDREGVVRKRWTGFGEGMEVEVGKAIEAALRTGR